MRIAVSGAHETGKTTLAEELADTCPGFVFIEEPYNALVAQGHVFGDLPGPDDFELQLQVSIESVLHSGPRSVFDRCPLDHLAYLRVLDNPTEPCHTPRLEEAMHRLDLIVFCSIEEPDRIVSSSTEWSEVRRLVDEELRNTVMGDHYAFGVPAVEISGSRSARLAQARDHVERGLTTG